MWSLHPFLPHLDHGTYETHHKWRSIPDLEPGQQISRRNQPERCPTSWNSKAEIPKYYLQIYKFSNQNHPAQFYFSLCHPSWTGVHAAVQTSEASPNHFKSNRMWSQAFSALEISSSSALVQTALLAPTAPTNFVLLQFVKHSGSKTSI